VKYEFLRGQATDGGPEFNAMRLIGSNTTTEAKRISADTLVPTELLLAGKISEAIDGYRKIQRDTPQNVAISAGRLNTVGYYFMEQQKKLPEAIAVFKLSVEFYPKEWNPYDSLADAYLMNGEKDLAIANYKKSLELNPQNSNAREKLKQLGAQ
jgi:tetratricopeptide (TPR) repeat protein